MRYATDLMDSLIVVASTVRRRTTLRLSDAGTPGLPSDAHRDLGPLRLFDVAMRTSC